MTVTGFLMVISLFAGTAGPSVASGSMQPQPIPTGVEFISDEFLLVLTGKRSEYRESGWPRDLEKTRVERSKVPNDLLALTNDWLRTMIKGQYLPSDPNQWWIPIRKPKPPEPRPIKNADGTVTKGYVAREGSDDYLVMRYSIGGHSFQIQDNTTTVRLLIEVNDVNLFHPKIDQFVTNALYKFLNYPEDEKGAMKFYLQEFEYNKTKVFYGTIDCAFDRNNSEAYSRTKRTWWNHTYMWSDGRRIYLSLLKTDPIKPQIRRTNPSPRPGLSPRFLK